MDIFSFITDGSFLSADLKEDEYAFNMAFYFELALLSKKDGCSAVDILLLIQGLFFRFHKVNKPSKTRIQITDFFGQLSTDEQKGVLNIPTHAMKTCELLRSELGEDKTNRLGLS